MVLKGKDKEVWWHFKQIKNSKQIPTSIKSIYAIDSNEDDDYICSIIKYVKNINEIFLKGTNVTDECLHCIVKTTNLDKLTLSRNTSITKNALPYINQLTSLTYLDVTKTEIDVTDLHQLENLQNLKEIHVSTNLDENKLPDELILELQYKFKNCLFFINYKLVD